MYVFIIRMEDGVILTNGIIIYFLPLSRKRGWVNVYFSMNKSKYVGEEIYLSKEEAIKNNKYRIYIATIKIEWEE